MKVFFWKIYTYSFFDQFILLYTSYSLLFKDSGLDSLQIGLLFGILPVTTLLFEVPTGVLADKYPRRNLLFLAQLLKAAGYACWLFMGNYLGFAIGFFLWGFSTTLVSGTFEPFVYDELKAFNLQDSYEKVHGRIDAFKYIGMTLATLLGGFVAEFGYDKVLVPSIFAPLLAGCLILTTRSVHAEKSTEEREYWHILKSAFLETRGNAYLLQLMIYMVIAFGVMEGTHEFWGLFLQERNVSLTLMGVIFAVANAAVSAAGFTSHLWRLHGKRLYLFSFVGCFAGIAIAFFNVWIAVLLSLIFSYFLQVVLIKYEARVQHEIESSQRATVTSIKSLATQLCTFIYFILVGVLADRFGYVSFFWLAGSIIAVLSTIYLFLKSKKGSSEADDVLLQESAN